MTDTPRSITLLPITVLLAAALCACGDTGDASAASGDPAGAAPPATARVLRGTVDVDPIVGVDDGAYACLYLMAWRDARQGPPQIAKKLPAGPLPVEFALDARDLAGAGTIAGDWIVVARLDGDGDAMPGAGDLEGVSRAPLRAGAPPATVFLSERLTEADARPMTAPPLAEAPTDGLPAGHPPTDTGTPGFVHPPTDGAPDTASPKTGPRIRGTISLAEEFASLDGTRTLFVMLKDKTTARGMPRAVLKVDRPRFPLTFDLGVEHVPLQVENKEDLIAGVLYLTARLDADGDVMGGAGDIELALPVEVQADEAPVSVVLDTRRTQ